MYKIDESQDKEKYILLIPSMLDAHFPLIKYAFYSKNYHPIILENEDGITDAGLKYLNNDMCYPCILNAGQMLKALESGQYDLKRTKLLMPTAGDACRGSNYLHVIQKAIHTAGFKDSPVISINLMGLEKGNQLILEPFMVWRALFGLFYGDILMILLNQTRPYELEKGSANRLWQKWIDILSEDLKKGKNLSIRHLKSTFHAIAKDFRSLPKTSETKPRVGIVGELYIKYCHLGNWNMIKFLEESGCESYTNGLSWYAMYYMDSHAQEAGNAEAIGYGLGIKFFASIQNEMIKAIREQGFFCLEPFETVKNEAKELVSNNLKIGDGWLIGSEAVGFILHGCPKVLAMQPFGCMPNHCCGRGLYPSLNRRLKNGHIVSIDVDSSGSPSNVYNRVRMLVDF